MIAEKILTTPIAERRLLGWTMDQWATVVAQVEEGRFPPTRDGALALRKFWMNGEPSADYTLKDPAWALELFRSLR